MEHGQHVKWCIKEDKTGLAVTKQLVVKINYKLIINTVQYEIYCYIL